MNKAEFAMLGVVLCEYREAVQIMDGCISTAIDISKGTDPDTAACLIAMRLSVLQSCSVVENLLERGKRKES